MAEGWITIGTELSTDKFDRQISQLEKKMQKEEDKKIVIDTKLSGQEQELERQRKKVDELAEAYERMANAQSAIEKGVATPKQYTDYFGMKDTYGSLEQLGTTFDRALDKQDAIEQKVLQTRNQYQGIVDKVEEYRQKVATINMQKHQRDIDKVKSGLNGVGNSLQGAIKKASRFALAIFGIRSAYLALRRASSDLASYDQQYAANLEYIRFVLTQAVAPILRYIVGLAMQLLSYINAIAQAWFGVNLFANGSVEAFKKMKAGAGGVGKAVKEIKKQLLGFDEINMLTDQSDSGTSAGAGGVGLPNMDLSQMQGDIPDWLQWIIDHGEFARKILEGIAAAFLSLKFGLGLLQGLGVFLIIDGIVELVKDIKDFVNNPVVQKFGEILQDIGLIILGIGLAIGSIPTGLAGLLAIAIGDIVSAVGSLIDFFKSPNLDDFIDFLSSALKSTGALGGAIDGLVQVIFGGWDNVKNIIKESQRILEEWMTNINKYFSELFSNIWNDLQNKIKSGEILFNAFKNNAMNIFNIVSQKFSEIFTNLVNRIKNIFGSLVDYFRGIWNSIISLFGNVGTRIGDAISGSFKYAINNTLAAVERILNTPIRTINGLINSLRNLPGLGGLRTLSTFSLPRLAVGGIVNMPNRGTLVGGAIAGESGREGVIPLTDSQAMAQLGREIGRYITINANITNTMNGRTISRELKQIQNQQDFAYNM